MNKQFTTIIFIMAALAIGCSKKKKQEYDDRYLKEFILSRYGNNFDTLANNIVFLLHNEDCACVAGEFDVAKTIINDPRYASYNKYIFLQKDKAEFLKKIGAIAHLNNIYTTPTELIQQGIIVSMNRYFVYQKGELTEIRDFKKLL